MSYFRKINDNKKLNKLYEKTKTKYGSGCYYNERKNRYIKYTCNNSWTKNHCKRITRRKLSKNDYILSNNLYKKVYDYWWEII